MHAPILRVVKMDFISFSLLHFPFFALKPPETSNDHSEMPI